MSNGLVCLVRPRKNNCWFPVTRPTLILTPDPTKFFSFSHQQKNASMGKKTKQKKNNKKTITSYLSIVMVTDIFHDIHLPVDKTSIFTARGSTVVSGLAVSKNKISK
jgi:hypothetical protein